MTPFLAFRLVAVATLLLGGAGVTATAQERPRNTTRPATPVAASADPTRRAVEAHLAREPKRKKVLALSAGKDEQARHDAPGTPAGRTATPVRARKTPSKGPTR